MHPDRYGFGMAIDDPNAQRLTAPLAPVMFGQGPLIPPPPPTGSLTPPAPPALPTQPPDMRAAPTAQPANTNAAHRAAGEDAPARPPAQPGAASGAHLPEGLRSEMAELLSRAGGRLQEVFDHYREGVTSPAALTAAGASPSEPIADNLLLRIRTLLGEPWTSAPGRARSIADAARSLMRTADLSREVRRYLTDLRSSMLDLAESEAGQQQEQAQLDANSVVLQREMRTANGVYVYTFPHYWRYPYQAELSRRLVRLGRTAEGVWQHTLDQARAAGAPEDPVLLRLYVATDPAAAEQAFHRLLQSADHARAVSNNGSPEWFATRLEFLDEIAAAIGSEIKAGTDPVI
jgi:hypothetical protein